MPDAFYTVRPIIDWSGARTPADDRRSRWTFKAGWSDTVGLLNRELYYLYASNIVVQVDVTEADLRLDGQLRANARPTDPGVRLLFDTRDRGPLTFQTDTCELWQHNVRSIALGLEALRAVDRYGITQHGQQYKGYRELEAGTGSPTSRADAVALLNLWAKTDVPETEDAPARLLMQVWRRARLNAHPDRGGTTDAFHAVDAAARTLGLLP